TTATKFNVSYYKNYKLVSNFETKENFALYLCGTPPPTNLPPGTKNFSIPLSNDAIQDSSEIPFLEALGLRSSIKAIDDSVASFVVSPCLQSLENNISVLNSNNKTSEAKILSVISAVFGNEPNSSVSKFVSTSSIYEPSGLDRAEWIKFYSTFFNLENQANNIYNQIDSNYNCLKNVAASNAQSTKPVVAWAVYIAPSSYNNNTASWAIADASYKKSFTEDAGGTYFNLSTLTYSTSSDFLSAIANVDILIDETYLANSISDVYKNYGLTANSNYKFVKNSAIYREDGLQNPSGGLDWFESAVLKGDVVLGDLVNVINPNLPTKGYQRVWFRNVAKNESFIISSATNCTNTSAPLTDQSSFCSIHVAA
ncbi:17352_t:CDS:2, partial [Acaulospora colombiana]